MNERARRNQQPRRQVQAQSSTSQQSHRNNVSTANHGRPAEACSSSNYRHPSTTTTTTSPSSVNLSQDGRCDLSVCYSYLIAITSSFLVVLGIYLSLTRFNIRYLFISLLGILIEAIGACLYCVNIIRANKLSRRKQRVDSDEFTLANGLNFGESNLTNGGLITNSNNDQDTRQQAPVMHLLSNQALIVSAGDGAPRELANETNPTAIVNFNDSSHDGQGNSEPNEQVVSHSDTEGNSHLTVVSNSTLTNSPQTVGDLSGVPPSTAGTQNNFDKLPNNHTCQLGIEGTNLQASTSFSGSPFEALKLSPTSVVSPRNHDKSGLDAKLSNRDTPDFASTQVSSNLNCNMALHFSHQASEARGKPNFDTHMIRQELSDSTPLGSIIERPTSSVINNLPRPSEMQSTTITDPTSVDQETGLVSDILHLQIGSQEHSSANTSRSAGLGLVASGSIEAPPVQPRRRLEAAQQRAINTRRTLVMGLSGEEELIEIDEEDLDNMSVLPPSYESIVTKDTTSSSQ